MADRCDACSAGALLVVSLTPRHPRYNRRKPTAPEKRCARHADALLRSIDLNPNRYTILRDDVPAERR